MVEGTHCNSVAVGNLLLCLEHQQAVAVGTPDSRDTLQKRFKHAMPDLCPSAQQLRQPLRQLHPPPPPGSPCLTSAASGRNVVSRAAAACWPAPSSSCPSVTTSSKPHMRSSFSRPCRAPADRGPLPLPLLLLLPLLLGGLPCNRGGGGGTSTSCTSSSWGLSAAAAASSLSPSLSLNAPVAGRRVGSVAHGEPQTVAGYSCCSCSPPTATSRGMQPNNLGRQACVRH